MTWFGAGMAAERLALPASLMTGCGYVLTLTRPMAILLTRMRAAFEKLSAHLATSRVGKPTRLVFQFLLATLTQLLH